MSLVVSARDKEERYKDDRMLTYATVEKWGALVLHGGVEHAQGTTTEAGWRRAGLDQ